MSTFALATIIACVTIIVLSVLIYWLRQARRAKPDMYAMAAERIVNVEKPFVGRGVLRVVGKDPALGYGYNTKGRRFPERRRDEADTLGVLTHPNVSLGFGMDEFPLTRQEDRPAQARVESVSVLTTEGYVSSDHGSSSSDSGGGGGCD